MATAFENEQPDALTILRLLPHAVVVIASDWRITYANPEADRMLGEGGATLWERCPDLAQTAFASGFRYAMSDRTELLTESALPWMGWCQARALPTPDGGLLISLRQVHAHTLETGQAKHALLVGEIGDALTREESLHAALQRCAAAMLRHLEAALARIWILETGADYLELCASAGIATRIDRNLARVPLGHGQIGRIADDGEPYLTNEVATNSQLGDIDWVHRERLTSFAGYPLRVEDRVVGVMALYSRRPIDHDLLNALSTIADAISLGIGRKTADAARRAAETKLRTQAERLEILYRLGKELAAELDVGILVQKVIDTATKLAGAQIGAFFYHLPGKSDETHTLYAVGGGHRGAFESSPLPRMTPLLAPSLSGQGVVRIDNIHEDPSYGSVGPHFGLPPGHAPVTSYLSIPVRGHQGRSIGALLFGHDAPGVFTPDTERLLAGIASTAAIAMENARLFQEAHDLIEALEKSNAELDQFAYIASHDLKAPLRGIANLAQWIEDDLADHMNEQTQQHMQLLRGRVIRLENLIGGILAYSRAGKERGEIGEVDLGQLAAEVWELLAPTPSAHLSFEGDLPRLLGSRVQLQQLLLNLVGNALKYNPHEELHVQIGARRERDHYRIWVKDDGVGIAPEFHDTIWGLFQTLERRDKLESTGIGLSVVRKIVESRGGRSWVESAPGEGATFYVTWPLPADRQPFRG